MIAEYSKRLMSNFRLDRVESGKRKSNLAVCWWADAGTYCEKDY